MPRGSEWEAFVFMPADTPIVNQAEAGLYGAKAFLVDGLINDCGAIVRDEHRTWVVRCLDVEGALSHRR